MRHPFASVQYFQSSLSSESLETSLEQRRLVYEIEEGQGNHEVTAPLPLPPLQLTASSAAVTRPRSAMSRPSPRLSIPFRRRKPTPMLPDTDVSSRDGSEIVAPPSSGKASPGHFVKHSSKVTLLLNGQKDDTPEPVYSRASTIIGMLAIPRPSGLLSLEVKVEGHIKLKEIAGGGTFDGQIINETLYMWNAREDPSFPSKVNFRYTLPTHYSNMLTGERSRLPPTYEAYLPGIPGFTVKISYGVYVYITHIRDRSDWWRKGRRLRIPFRYEEHTRPAQPGPFPLSVVKTPISPKTVFEFKLRSRQRNCSDIDVHLFLPGSRVCSIKEPIQFLVSLFGDEDALSPFVTYQPSPVSFHPLSHSHSIATSIQARFAARVQPNPLPSPIRVHLSRRTAIDARAAGMMIEEENSHMGFSKPVEYGVIHTSNRSSNSITYSGSLTIPSSIKTGGFSTSGIQVTDAIELSILPPETARSRFLPLSQSVPIRLTTETYDCPSPTVTVSDWE